jgi:hypothetical protein
VKVLEAAGQAGVQMERWPAASDLLSGNLITAAADMQRPLADQQQGRLGARLPLALAGDGQGWSRLADGGGTGRVV